MLNKLEITLSEQEAVSSPPLIYSARGRSVVAASSANEAVEQEEHMAAGMLARQLSNLVLLLFARRTLHIFMHSRKNASENATLW